jgi:hypothetical protein
MWDRTGAYRGLEGRLKEKRQHKRPTCRRENNIKMYLQKVGWPGMDWIGLAQDRNRWRDLVNAVMNLRVP